MTQCGNNKDSNLNTNFSKEESFSIKKNTLVLFYAEWCGWSQKMLPEFEKLMQKKR
jgi:thiol-disulfide isomerase/thioredoxin